MEEVRNRLHQELVAIPRTGVFQHYDVYASRAGEVMTGYSEHEQNLFIQAFDRYMEKFRWAREVDRQVFMQRLREDYKAAAPTVLQHGLVALTICPANSSSHMDLLPFIEAVKTVTAVTSMVYVYEQRSEGDEPEHGWHIHAQVETMAYPAKLKQYVLQKFKSRDLVASIKCDRVYNANWKDQYMIGAKHNDAKAGKVAKDIVLRERYGIPLFMEFRR